MQWLHCLQTPTTQTGVTTQTTVTTSLTPTTPTTLTLLTTLTSQITVTSSTLLTIDLPLPHHFNTTYAQTTLRSFNELCAVTSIYLWNIRVKFLF